MIKICKICNQEKDQTLYHKGRNQCKLCYHAKQNAQPKTKLYKARSYQKHKIKRNQYHKDYVAANTKAVAEVKRQWYLDHKEEVNKRRVELNKQYLLNKPDYKLKQQIRTRFARAIKGNYKAGSAIDNLGCSIEFLRSYLEAKFQPDMTWDNHGRSGWHIDHIKPLDSFNLSNLDELKEACHYTNLQPLWAKDNLKKGHK